jgi:hypothetical protein
VQLRFSIETVGSAGNWYVDDVSLELTAAKSDAGMLVAPDPAILNARKPAPGVPTP